MKQLVIYPFKWGISLQSSRFDKIELLILSGKEHWIHNNHIDTSKMTKLTVFTKNFEPWLTQLIKLCIKNHLTQSKSWFVFTILCKGLVAEIIFHLLTIKIIRLFYKLPIFWKPYDKEVSCPVCTAGTVTETIEGKNKKCNRSKWENGFLNVAKLNFINYHLVPQRFAWTTEVVFSNERL